MNILLTISYKGTNYCGWQIQDNAISIQEIIESTIYKVLKQQVTLIASGRTDAGVHAIKQCASVELDFPSPEKLPYALNPFLPDDIKILSAKEVAKDFNARFSAKQKTYLYKISIDEFENPLSSEFETTLNYHIDLKKMIKASKYLMGEHNFKSFCASKTQTKDFVRTIYEIKIEQKDNHFEFYITGNGFLYNMVRIIVGVLVDVGRGAISPKQVDEILQRQNRIFASKTMPAKGLYLLDVKYDNI